MRKARLPQSRKHVFVYDDDWDFLMENFSKNPTSANSASSVLREIIHNAVGLMRQRLIDRADKTAATPSPSHGEPPHDN